MVNYSIICLFGVFYGHLWSFSDLYPINMVKMGHLAHK